MISYNVSVEPSWRKIIFITSISHHTGPQVPPLVSLTIELLKADSACRLRLGRLRTGSEALHGRYDESENDESGPKALGPRPAKLEV